MHLQRQVLQHSKMHPVSAFAVIVLLPVAVFSKFSNAVQPSRSGSHYEPTWESLDSRPLPEWYDEAKFGIFMHWGLYSEPAFGGAWLWQNWKEEIQPWVKKFIEAHYPPDWTYADWAKEFHAWWYQPNKWTEIFKKAGAKYIVLTTKHHDGFCNFPSPNAWNWNAKDVGPNRDLVGELVTALRNGSDIKVGLYYSLYEFFNPIFLQDQKNKYKTQNYIRVKPMPDLKYIVNKYKPDIVWSDGDWMAPSSYWNSTEFLAWLYNESPVKDTVATNDRWGSDATCKHGGYFSCNDRYNPGKIVKHKWENAMTVDKSYWPYQINRDIEDFYTVKELIKFLVPTISYGGNLLMNVGITGKGTIIPVFQERLVHMGEWLSVNGAAIYATHPCRMQNDTLSANVWYTCKDSPSGIVDVYAILLEWPETPVLSLEAGTPSDDTRISMLGYPGTLSWKRRSGGGLDISIPTIPINKMPSLWAWTLKIENLKSPGLVWTKMDYRSWQESGDDNTLHFEP